MLRDRARRREAQSRRSVVVVMASSSRRRAPRVVPEPMFGRIAGRREARDVVRCPRTIERLHRSVWQSPWTNASSPATGSRARCVFWVAPATTRRHGSLSMGALLSPRKPSGRTLHQTHPPWVPRRLRQAASNWLPRPQPGVAPQRRSPRCGAVPTGRASRGTPRRSRAGFPQLRTWPPNCWSTLPRWFGPASSRRQRCQAPQRGAAATSRLRASHLATRARPATSMYREDHARGRREDARDRR